MRVYNFAAGPAVLPLEVLQEAQEQLPDWQGRGMSVMEVSHRSKEFIAVAAEAEQDLRDLLDIPANYRVLFLQGGATAQFAAVPMNLTEPGAVVDYVNTGAWSKKAIGEARQFCKVNVVADEKASNYSTIPAAQDLSASDGAVYFHYTPNETIGGVEFPYIPDTGAVPLVADMSSNILSQPLEIDRYGLIYAGAQKNIGPSGLCVVIVRDDLLGRGRSATPLVLDYKQMAEAGSMLNTPPTFAWYVAGLVFKWLKRRGGLAQVARDNAQKSKLLYDYIDASGFYANPVHHDCRSRMNVPFTIARDGLDGKFLGEAKAAGLVNLEGHRSVGGMRASIYNAMPQDGVRALVAFMTEFARRNG
ncbi:MAG: 3-phosphoserine/phosphohydroxythreonine transaminase [Steroidobacteraceae bacterium]